MSEFPVITVLTVTTVIVVMTLLLRASHKSRRLVVDILCVRQKTTLEMRLTAVAERINRDAALHKKCKTNLKAAGIYGVINGLNLIRNYKL